MTWNDYSLIWLGLVIFYLLLTTRAIEPFRKFGIWVQSANTKNRHYKIFFPLKKFWPFLKKEIRALWCFVKLRKNRTKDFSKTPCGTSEAGFITKKGTKKFSWEFSREKIIKLFWAELSEKEDKSCWIILKKFERWMISGLINLNGRPF